MRSKELSVLDAEIEKKEQELFRVKEELAQLRKQKPLEIVKDYLLKSVDGAEIYLSELFKDKDELIVIHNMGKSCSYCTLWGDTFNGVTKHIESRASFVLMSPDDYGTLADFSKSREWAFDCVSTQGTSFKEDLGFKDETGLNYPGVSVLLKDEDGTIRHYTRAAFGPGDDYCGIWSLFELLPEGSKDWSPKHDY